MNLILTREGIKTILSKSDARCILWLALADTAARVTRSTCLNKSRERSRIDATNLTKRKCNLLANKALYTHAYPNESLHKENNVVLSEVGGHSIYFFYIYIYDVWNLNATINHCICIRKTSVCGLIFNDILILIAICNLFSNINTAGCTDFYQKKKNRILGILYLVNQ